MIRARGVLLALVADVLAVGVFAVVGRGSHAEGLDAAGVVGTAAPFLGGLAVGWLVGRVWRGPTALPAGLWALGGAAVLGLALRGLLTGRLPMAFVLVTALSLALLVLGWRLIAAAVLRTRTVSI
ncbi:MAG: DUF3054 domain-containing protein [Pseudonocardia sp.]